MGGGTGDHPDAELLQLEDRLKGMGLPDEQRQLLLDNPDFVGPLASQMTGLFSPKDVQKVLFEDIYTVLTDDAYLKTEPLNAIAGRRRDLSQDGFQGLSIMTALAVINKYEVDIREDPSIAEFSDGWVATVSRMLSSTKDFHRKFVPVIFYDRVLYRETGSNYLGADVGKRIPDPNKKE